MCYPRLAEDGWWREREGAKRSEKQFQPREEVLGIPRSFPGRGRAGRDFENSPADSSASNTRQGWSGQATTWPARRQDQCPHVSPHTKLVILDRKRPAPCPRVRTIYQLAASLHLPHIHLYGRRSPVQCIYPDLQRHTCSPLGAGGGVR